MQFNEELQQLVEKIAKPNPTGSWDIDHNYAEEFFKLISPYIKKSTYSSDKYDPQDAYADIRFQVWQALEKYGPRPYGNDFIYILRKKTKNTLIDRYRQSQTMKYNMNNVYALDEVHENSLQGYSRDTCSILDLNDFEFTKIIPKFIARLDKVKEELLNFSTIKNKLYNSFVELDFSSIRESICKLSITNKINLLYYILDVLKNNDVNVTDIICQEFFKIDINRLVSEEFEMIDLKNIQIGKKYFVKGIAIEVRKIDKENNTCSIYIYPTEEVIIVSPKYLTKNLEDGSNFKELSKDTKIFIDADIVTDNHDQLEDNIEKDIKDKQEEVKVKEHITEEANTKKFIEEDSNQEDSNQEDSTEDTYNDIDLSMKNPFQDSIISFNAQEKLDMINKKKKEIKHRKISKTTIKQRIIELLSEKEHNKRDLASTLIKENLTKSKVQSKVMASISVYLNHLKKEGYKIEKARSGYYKII